MLVKFNIDGGCEPVTQQARADVLSVYLTLLNARNPSIEQTVRGSIRAHLDRNPTFTAKQIASTGSGQEWKPEFEELYQVLLDETNDADIAFAEAGKCLGLLVWSEALEHDERWHFTQYPKDDADYLVTHYFAVDGHIRFKALMDQAETARSHGDLQRATELEAKAFRLRDRWNL